MKSVNRIAMLGLGLISGSLAKALKSADWHGKVCAWGPREPSLALGKQLGVVDEYDLDLNRVLADADVVVVGAPPAATGALLNTILPQLARRKKPPVVTDLASIKGHVVTQIDGVFDFFVPGHPIAGSEHSGVAASDSALFVGREVILTPLATTDAKARQIVREMWLKTGAYVTEMTMTDHDHALAASSHMPHMLAYALTRSLMNDPLKPMQHGGGALRDMTRIAGSDSMMWRDIAVTNRAAVVQAMDEFSAQWSQLRQLVDASDGDGLYDYFQACRSFRREHEAILNPLRREGEEDQVP